MKDNYGDRIEVSTSEDAVYIDVYNEDALAVHAYTPAKARKLAKKLNAAADEIDPRDDEPTVSIEMRGNAEELADSLREHIRRIGSNVQIATRKDNSRGYRDGDAVLFADINAVLSYNAADDAWYSAGPEAHDCGNEFDHAKPGSVFLIARDGKPYNGVGELLTRTGVRTWNVA